MVYHDHICGCYFLVPSGPYPPTRKYLPQARVKAHTTVFSSVAKTFLTQSYDNLTEDILPEVRYTFPLFDGVSVVRYEVKVGDRTIKGLVKQKEEAKKTFKEAVARGETAGLLEQLLDAADVFTSTIGNVPANTTIEVSIAYVAELKHDSEVDGTRVTFPTNIAPRYGCFPGALLNMPGRETSAASIDVTVDVHMDEGRPISKLLSPSHPISVNIGTLSTDPNAHPSITKGSASLALGDAGLERDFVLQIIAKDVGIPRAMLETHPEMPGHRALTATLVPKFKLKPIRPEIVIVADRSGSMGGSSMTILIAALQVLLKSFPMGVRFNICSFGSSPEFLWPQSQAYNESNLEQALKVVSSMTANLGGTETLDAIKAAIENRQKTLPTEILLLTDGDIWGQQQCFDYIRDEVRKSDNAIRVFPIGIGNGVSSALIEGVARAGNGIAQQIQSGERLDTKAVRMLKAALTPHVSDYSLEVNYRKDDAAIVAEYDDFELVEKVSDCLTLAEDTPSETATEKSKPISLYDKDRDPSIEEDDDDNASPKDRYSHLPSLSTPKLLQAPREIPSLFPLSRTSIYLLLSAQTAHLRPVSVTLRGTAPEGPLELQIPIEELVTPGTTIHQLAAKKAIQELEEADGWLGGAKDSNGRLIKEVHAARFDEIREREAVRLGVEHQVGGKWCSFVAVEDNAVKEHQYVPQQSPEPASTHGGLEFSSDSSTTDSKPSLKCSVQRPSATIRLRPAASSRAPSGTLFGAAHGGASSVGPSSMFGSGRAAAPPPPMASAVPGLASGSGSRLSSAVRHARNQARQSPGEAPDGEVQQCVSGSRTAATYWVLDSDITDTGPQAQKTACSPGSKSDEHVESSPKDTFTAAVGEFLTSSSTLEGESLSRSPTKSTSKTKPDTILDSPTAHNDDAYAFTLALIAESRSLGGWAASILSFKALRIGSDAQVAKLKQIVNGLDDKEDVIATAVVVQVLRKILAPEEEVWEMVVEKAEGWLDATLGKAKGDLEAKGLMGAAQEVVMEAFKATVK